MPDKNLTRFFTINITAAGITVTGEYEIDDDVTKVKGFWLSSDREDLLFYRGTLYLKFNGAEWVEAGTQAKNFMNSSNVDYWLRMWPFGDGTADPGDQEMAVDYTDNDHPNTVFEPYSVHVFVEFDITPP